METVLIGTLGTEPQVITLATALLRQEGVARVVAVHTDARFAPIAGALPALCSAFAEAPDASLLECVVLDVAQLLLGPGDHVWHLHPDEALRHSGRFWPATGDAVHLIELPLTPPVEQSTRMHSIPARKLENSSNLREQHRSLGADIMCERRLSCRHYPVLPTKKK